MRIDKVEIDGFGKLNNCSFDFSSGLNLIYGKNESGKSTLCEFILAMFYGLPNKSRQSSDDLASRIKYKPWNKDSFGGRVYFTDDAGKKMVIERSFKLTKRGDKAVLRDANTWEELTDAENIGEKCFGLTREGFLKTLFVKSFGADNLKSDDGEIMSRLSNLETSGDESVSYSKIVNAMEKEIFSLKTKTGRGGKITALDDKILALNNEKTISSLTHQALENDKIEAENLKSASEEKEKQAKILENKYSVALQYEKYLAQKELAETKKIIEDRLIIEKEKKEKLKHQIDNFDKDDLPLISTETISNARALETKKLLAEEKVIEKQKNLNTQQKKSSIIISLISAFLGLVIIALALFVKNSILAIAGVIFVILGIGATLYTNFKNKKTHQRKMQEYDAANDELDNINREVLEFFKPYGVSISDELSALFVSNNDKEMRLLQLKKQYEECEKEIENLKNSIPNEADNVVCSEDVKGYDGENAQKLFEMINILKSESRKISDDANEISLRIAKQTAEIRNEDEIEKELNDATEEKEELKKQYSSLVKALEWLTKAHTEIKNNFAPRLNKKASELISTLTGDRYKDMRSNDNFYINLKATNGEIVEAEYMSRGTYDLIYIALRFAAMSVLTDNKIPTVILDDAFSQLDDERLQKAVDLIENSGEFSQVLLFTCHENYKHILKKSNIIELQ